ncbi:MAG: diaminopimelate decarboxylase [Bacteroidales bacterium]|nr:diaminopimelate decarboxylase [Bacteroidales bacterium]
MLKTVETQLSKTFLSKEEMASVFRRALKAKNLISREDTAVLFYDLDFLSERILNLKSLFPKTTFHAIAVKANPLVRILEYIKTLDVGLEVASLPELYLAQKAGFPSEKIAFDSPAKTREELEYALKAGVWLNADSFAELDRIGEILEKTQSKSRIGVRLNPQVGMGNIKITSVSDAFSKFGIPMNEHRRKIKEYFFKYEWLKGVHVHVGSQGCPVYLLLEGIKKAFDFVNEINEAFESRSLEKRIEVFDIGGGLPVSYDVSFKPVLMDEYHNLLREKMPALFSDDFQMITEFGRYIHANTGWAASRVEYVKREKDYNIIMTHLGADMLLRVCYNPDDWHHQFSVVDKDGNLKKGEDKFSYSIAGPLCFAGDILARDIELPYVEEGDFIIIHDIGAYTLSMWSRYNSRQIPKIIGYHGSEVDFEILKKRESEQDLIDFWT